MATISLCMMCKKEDYSFLNTCLRNVYSGVDEIIMVVDKIDEEITRIAKQFSVKLIEHQYKDSSAEQRNISLEQAKMDWILILDADEILALDDLVKLKGITKDGDCIAYTLNQVNYTDDENQTRFIKTDNQIAKRFGFKGYFSVPTIRFFKNNIGFYFTRRVHEMVDESIEEKGLLDKVGNTDIPMHHLKQIKGEDITKKNEIRYLHLLELETKDNPNSFKAFFDIGTINLFTMKNYQESIKNLKKSIEINPDFIDAKLNLAFAYGELKEYEKALHLYKEISERQKTFHILSNIAVCCFWLKKYKESIEYYTEAGELEPKQKEDIDKKIQTIKSIISANQ